MADQVQYILDRMAPVLVELQRLGIFALSEVKSIVAARKQHEYKLKRRQLTVADFLAYLEYEMNLEELRRTRMKRLRIHNAGKAEGFGVRHVSYIFERAVRRFPKDIALWEAYLNFLQKYNSKSIFSSVLMRALHLHPRNAQLWIRAASMETVLNGNSHAARVLMQRAIRINPHDKELWLFYFKQEMFEAVKVQKRRAALGLATVKRKGDGSVEETKGDTADNDEDGEITNAGLQRLMRGDIASIVFNHAMESSGIKSDELMPFALQLYEQAFQYRHDLPAVRETVEARVTEEFQGEATMYLTLADIQLFSGEHTAPSEDQQMTSKSKRRKLGEDGGDDESAEHADAMGEFGNAIALLTTGLERLNTMSFRSRAAELLTRFVRAHSSTGNSDHFAASKQLLDRLIDPLLSDSETALATEESFQAAVQLAQAYFEMQLLLPEHTKKSSQVQQVFQASEWLFMWLQTAFAAIAATNYSSETHFALTSAAHTSLLRLERFGALVSATEEKGGDEDVQARVDAMKDATAELLLGSWRQICLVEDAHEQIAHALQYLSTEKCLQTLREIVTHVSSATVNDGYVSFWCKQYVRRAYQFEGVESMLAAHQFLMKNTFATAATNESGGSKFLKYFLFVIEVVTSHATNSDATERSKWYELSKQLHEQALRTMAKTSRQALYNSYIRLEIANGRPERANQIRWRASKDP